MFASQQSCLAVAYRGGCFKIKPPPTQLKKNLIGNFKRIQQFTKTLFVALKFF